MPARGPSSSDSSPGCQLPAQGQQHTVEPPQAAPHRTILQCVEFTPFRSGENVLMRAHKKSIVDLSRIQYKVGMHCLQYVPCFDFPSEPLLLPLRSLARQEKPTRQAGREYINQSRSLHLGVPLAAQSRFSLRAVHLTLRRFRFHSALSLPTPCMSSPSQMSLRLLLSSK